jgi:hypothetical protein
MKPSALHLEQSTVSSILLTEISSKSPGFIKSQTRCLNLNVAKASRPQRTYETASDACLQLSHSGQSVSPSLSTCPFTWQCPVKTLSLFLTGFCSDWVIPQLFYQRLLRKPLACLCPQMDCQYSLCFVFIQPIITPLATFADIPRASSEILYVDVKGLVWLTDQPLYFHQFPSVMAPTPVLSCYVLLLSSLIDSIWKSII